MNFKKQPFSLKFCQLIKFALRQSCPIPSKQSTIESQFKGKDLEVWTTFRRYIEALPTPKRQCAVRAIGDSYRNIFVECVNRFAPGVTARPLKDEIELPQEVLKLL